MKGGFPDFLWYSSNASLYTQTHTQDYIWSDCVWVIEDAKKKVLKCQLLWEQYSDRGTPARVRRSNHQKLDLMHRKGTLSAIKQGIVSDIWIRALKYINALIQLCIQPRRIPSKPEAKKALPSEWELTWFHCFYASSTAEQIDYTQISSFLSRSAYCCSLLMPAPHWFYLATVTRELDASWAAAL